MEYFGGLCSDVLLEIVLYLTPKEVVGLTIIGKVYKEIFENDYVWRFFTVRKYGPSITDKKPKEKRWKQFYKDSCLDYFLGINWSVKPLLDITVPKYHRRGWIVDTDHSTRTSSIRKVGNHYLWLLTNRKVWYESKVVLTLEVKCPDDKNPSAIVGVKMMYSEEDISKSDGWSNSYAKSFIHTGAVYSMSFRGSLYHQHNQGNINFRNRNFQTEEEWEKAYKSLEPFFKKGLGGGRISILLKDQKLYFACPCIRSNTSEDENKESFKLGFENIEKGESGYYQFFLITSGQLAKFRIIEFRDYSGTLNFLERNMSGQNESKWPGHKRIQKL